MDNNNTDAAASASQDTSSASTTTPEAPVYTKADLTRITTREVGKVRDELRAAQERLAAYEREKSEAEEQRRTAEEAKMSAVQRLEAERKRERDAYEAKLSTLAAEAQKAHERRHSLMRQHAASGIVSRIAARLFNPDLAPDVERIVADRVVVEADGDGTERLALTLGSPGDTEPLTDQSVQKLIDTHVSRYFRAAGGSGATHGTGANGRQSAVNITDPTARIAAGLANKR